MPAPTRATLALLTLCLAGSALADAPPAAEQALLAADAARSRAMVAADVTALDAALADELVYGHTNGLQQSKRELLGQIKSGELRYLKLATDEVTARSYGCAGVVTGTAAADVEGHGRAASFTLHYTATYVQQAGRWRLAAYQSVRLP